MGADERAGVWRYIGSHHNSAGASVQQELLPSGWLNQQYKDCPARFFSTAPVFGGGIKHSGVDGPHFLEGARPSHTLHVFGVQQGAVTGPSVPFHLGPSPP
jgi:hypothetical protein